MEYRNEMHKQICLIGNKYEAGEQITSNDLKYKIESMIYRVLEEEIVSTFDSCSALNISKVKTLVQMAKTLDLNIFNDVTIITNNLEVLDAHSID